MSIDRHQSKSQAPQANSLAVPAQRRARLQLPDGRSLSWYEWGPQDGRPVLLCSGAALSGSLGFGAAELPRLGLRLLALDRPGLGHSGIDPGKSFASWCADVRQWLSALEIGPLPVVGFSQGAVFAFALAAAGLASRLAIVSGQDELGHPEIRPLLAPEVAGMVAAIAQDPPGFEQAFAARADAEGFWQLILGMSGEADREIYTEPGFGAAFRQALDEGFAQGAAGYARDLVLAMGPWPFELEQIRVPVSLWYGGQDHSTVHSPDFGAILARRLPVARRHFVPDAGGSLLWTHAAAILQVLAESL